MRYRICPWGSIVGGTSAFGIQAQERKGQRFKHCCATIRGTKRALIYVDQPSAEHAIRIMERGGKRGLTIGLVPLVQP